MFTGCHNMTEFPAFNISASYISHFFRACWNITTIPNINTINVTLMEGLCAICLNLKNIPSLDTNNVISM